MKAELEEMCQAGVVQPSKSAYISPIVLVKKDGGLHFCIEYQKLNHQTKPDNYPLPQIKDTLDCLQGAQFFATLDFLAGYW